ncbi:hypothetical protein BTUL_0184g00270 [Botrytis tulipae]|uniref:Carboxylic ester hydrolase n=1 Tax=Botrytis tulipae TaxID=87230 RepID=A0A4Z1EBZ9_9HELO|nr:hypothetical protein BTUL_0184g00270 [Botrytis tulipae]
MDWLTELLLLVLTLHWNSFCNERWYFAGPNRAAPLSTSAHSAPGCFDPRHDVLLALMTWVENGSAP